MGMSASTMTLWVMVSCSLHKWPRLSKSGVNLASVTVYGCRHMPWEGIPMAQTLCIPLIRIWEAVWGGYRPQRWRNGAIFTLHKRPRFPKSGANLAGVMVQGCTHLPLKQHTNCSNTLYMFTMDVWSGLKWISVDISLSYDVMTVFALLKWPWLPKSGANLAGVIKLMSTRA